MIRTIVSLKIVCSILLFTGCSQQPLTAPSGAAVSGGISRGQSGVTQAAHYNDVAVTHNANAMTRVQRIDAKAAVIEKYWGK